MRTRRETQRHAFLERQIDLARAIELDSRNPRRLFVPNAKQWRLCSSRAVEVLLSGPNQYGGKTYVGRYLLATHATGDYPEEWEGPRYANPPAFLVCSKTKPKNMEQMIQPIFSENFGLENSALGPGWIRPGEYEPFSETAAQTIVYHKGPDGEINGETIINWLSYESAWDTAAGSTADGVFGNEIPNDERVYTELKARINARDGHLWLFGCPLQENPTVYYQFKNADQRVMELIEYGIDDCSHLSDEKYQEALARWKHHPEAAARLYGKPCRGGGIVFPYDRTTYTCPPRKPDPSWAALIGMDLPHALGHFAAVGGYHDRLSDVVYILGEFKAEAQETAVNARRVSLMGGTQIPIAWPHDGGVRTAKEDGAIRIADKYRACGLNMLPQAAFFYNSNGRRSKSKMAMVEEVQDRITTGRLKIAQNCSQLLDEMLTWTHRDGKIENDQDDHLIDATLKVIMMLRYAKPIGELDAESRRTLAGPVMGQRPMVDVGGSFEIF